MSRLVRTVYALAVAVLFTVAPATATTTISMDGVWWQGLSDAQKVVAVQAMLSGIGTGYVQGHVKGRANAYQLFNVPTDAILKTIQAGKMPPDSLDAPEFSKTFGVYVDEITVWHEAHSKTAMTPSFLLAECLSDKPTFSMEICESLGKDATK
jgi:hypothetical protein